MKRLKIILQSKLVLSLSLIFLILYVLIFTKVIQYHSNIPSTTSNIEGIILDYTIDGDKLSILLQAKEKIQVTYYLKNEDEKIDLQEKLKLGLTVNLEGELKEPSNNTIPNTFNYKKYLYNKKIYWLMTSNKITLISKDISLFYKIKNALVIKINTYHKTSSYLHAFILGINKCIDNDVHQAFKNNGVTHLFAISGMHISFLVATMTYLFKKLNFKEKTINFIIICFLLFYMLLVGLSASVIRASLLYIFILLNKKLNLNLNNCIILYWLFLILLIVNPFYIYDLGFAYSFLTSFGLMLFSSKIKGNYLKRTFLVSTVAFFFSLPITLYNFYEFNLLTIINNIIMVPMVSIFLFPLSLLTFILPILEPLLQIGFQVLEQVNRFCSSLSINIAVPKINLIYIIIYYAIIYLIYKYNFKYTIILCLLILIIKIMPIIDNKAYVYYLDVGQGDATLIITEHQSNTIMIDTGGQIEYNKEPWQLRNKNFDLSENIATFLKSKGIQKLDLLIITHGDADHIGYATSLSDKVRISKLMLNNNYINYAEKELLKKVPHHINNDYISKDFLIKNLNYQVSNDENESSLVLYFSLKHQNFLIMGDASKEVETKISEKYNLQVDFIKVGHHGSSTSSDMSFLKKINPKYAFISAGRNNRYNHPSKDTIKTLESLKINHFSTQEKGTIELILNKDHTKFKFYPP